MKVWSAFALLTAACLLTACTGESSLPTATGKGTVRVINAIKASPEIAFLIEERVIGGVGYKAASSPAQYDDLDYTFNFEAQLAGDSSRTRVASQFVEVAADTEYTLIVSGSLGNPDITVWEAPVRTFDAADTVLEVRFAHLDETMADVDIYLAAPATPPVLGQEIGSLSFGENLPPMDIAGGEYELILTAADEPATVLFTSGTLTLTNGTGQLFVFFEGNENDLGPTVVRAFSDTGGTTAVADVNLPPLARFIHATMDLDTADVYLDEMLMDPVLMSHAFGDITGDIPVTVGTQTLSYTPAGDTMSVLLESPITFFEGSIVEIFAVGQTDALTTIARSPDRAAVSTLVKFRLLHAANNHPLVDIYVVEADSDISEQAPLFFGVVPSVGTASANLIAGSQDLYITPNGETTAIAGPIRIDTVNGDIVDILLLDTVDPSMIDVVFIPAP